MCQKKSPWSTYPRLGGGPQESGLQKHRCPRAGHQRRKNAPTAAPPRSPSALHVNARSWPETRQRSGTVTGAQCLARLKKSGQPAVPLSLPTAELLSSVFGPFGSHFHICRIYVVIHIRACLLNFIYVRSRQTLGPQSVKGRPTAIRAEVTAAKASRRHSA